ncbi:MAG: DUF1592 domain-containing protein [Verrucomicrobiota bacterium]
MTKYPRLSFVLFIAGMLFVSTLVSTAVEPFPEELDVFLDQHCYDCHDDLTSKGDLDLLSLDFDLENPQLFATWERIFDRVIHGEMPPAKKERPSEEEMQSFRESLGSPLHFVDAQKKEQDGRVPMRRLTRSEFENTLHELLGVHVPIQDLLPEDRGKHGFEKVSSVQQLSHVLLQKYQGAADLVLDEAFRIALEGRQEWTVNLTHENVSLDDRLGAFFEESQIVSYRYRPPISGRFKDTEVPETGWYRIRVKGAKAKNRPKGYDSFWCSILSGEFLFTSAVNHWAGAFEVGDEPIDYVGKAWIEKGHRIQIIPGEGGLPRGNNPRFTGADGKQNQPNLFPVPAVTFESLHLSRIYPQGSIPKIRERLFGELEVKNGKILSDQPSAFVEELLRDFARLAFRRPVSDEEIRPYVELAMSKATTKEGGRLDIAPALKTGYRAILWSPRFLFLEESGGPLDAWAIAARMSLLLWESNPDETLLSAAENGTLLTREGRQAEANRMLRDFRARRFFESFTDQWLDLKNIAATHPDTTRFRQYDPILHHFIVEETRRYVRHLVAYNLSATHLVDSDFAFLNSRLARHYRLPVPPLATDLQKVSLPPDSPRGGLVTQASILKVTADGSNTSPILRGVWMNERILTSHLPPPPPGVPAVEPDVRGATSLREMLQKHRASENCASCHIKIDPPGYALENFDPVGNWRTHYPAQEGTTPIEVDASFITPKGEPFADIREWKALQTKDPANLARSFTEQLISHATGASMQFSDRPEVAAIVEASAQDSYGLRTLIFEVINSDLFLTK